MSDAIKPVPTLEMLRSKRDEILALAYQHGAFNIRVFGSVARAQASEGSDVDLLVNWDYVRMSDWGGTGFDLALADLLGIHVDVISEKGLSPLLRARVLKEAVPL